MQPLAPTLHLVYDDGGVRDLLRIDGEGHSAMRARLADVAKLANVHPATASRALNERTRSRVSPETLDRVMQAADALNYLPNTMARSLASARSSTIGVVIGDLTVPLFAQLIRGIDDVTSAAGYTALIVNTD